MIGSTDCIQQHKVDPSALEPLVMFMKEFNNIFKSLAKVYVEDNSLESNKEAKNLRKVEIGL